MPRAVNYRIVRWRTNREQRRYASLSLAEAFDQIYDLDAWADGGERAALNSGPGSTGRYKEEYCVLLRNLLQAHDVKSVADLGCGNFNTGTAIATMVGHYTGVDIAQTVIDANLRAYSSDHVHFERGDLTQTPLPFADAAIVRQVLQHLTNAEVGAALDNVRRTYPLAFITEHVYVGRSTSPNLDMPHGPGTRVPMRSGIFIDQPPFNATAMAVGDIPYAPSEVLRTWIVTGKGPTE